MYKNTKFTIQLKNMNNNKQLNYKKEIIKLQ